MMEQTEKQKFLFMQLALSLHSATMQQLGKLKNPMSNSVDRDLPGAQGSIDMLEMIRVRTKGNLSDDEVRFLDQILQELRLNYVDEIGKPEPPTAQAAPTTPGEEPS